MEQTTRSTRFQITCLLCLKERRPHTHTHRHRHTHTRICTHTHTSIITTTSLSSDRLRVLSKKKRYTLITNLHWTVTQKSDAQAKEEYTSASHICNGYRKMTQKQKDTLVPLPLLLVQATDPRFFQKKKIHIRITNLHRIQKGDIFQLCTA